jgi:hypothetical protein
LDARADGGFDSQVVRSDDDGITWAQLGAPLPVDLLPLTIDVAPSDATRVYVSGRLGSADGYASAVLRSTDGGQTFVRALVPESANHHLAYIAAVHPSDPDRVYVRVYDPTGTRIWMSEDGAITFRKVFTGTDQIFGFAVSPDGANVALGGPGDGIWVGPSDGTNFERRSDVLPTCLGWSSEGLFACADQATNPFSFGRSRDLGATFEPVLRFDALCGRTGCGTGTAGATLCPHDWDLVAAAVNSTCGIDAGAPDAATAVAAADAGIPPDAPPAVDARSEAAQVSPEVGIEASGGSCAVRRLPHCGKADREGSAFICLVALAAVRRRRRDQFLTIT